MIGSACATASARSRRLAPPLPEVLSAFWQPQPRTRSSTPRPSRRASPSTAATSRAATWCSRSTSPRTARTSSARRRAAYAQPAGAQARLLGRRAERRDRPRDRRAVPLQGDARAQGARDQGRGHTRPHRRGDAFGCAATVTSFVACSRRVPPGRIYFRGNDRSPATAPSTSARPPPRSRPGAARGLRPLQGGRRQGDRREEGHRRLFTAENLQGLPRVRQPRPPARREGQDGLPDRKRTAEGGPRPYRGASQLWRHRERSLPRPTSSPRSRSAGTSKSCACSSCLCCAPARLRRPARGKRSTRHRRRGARRLLEQQPVPPGVVPPEERHRVRRAGEGFRGLPRHLRK